MTVAPPSFISDSLQTAGVAIEKPKFYTLHSLLDLFKNLGCLEKHEDRYILADSPTVPAWKAFLQAAACVNHIELDSRAKQEASEISSSTYIWVTHQLKGKILFPYLDSVLVKSFDSLVDYLPLLISPALQSVIFISKFSDPAIPDIADVLRVALKDLAKSTPSLKSFKIEAPEISSLLMKNIVSLKRLHTLELATLCEVKSFDDFRALTPLEKLESLSLGFSDSNYSSFPGPITPIHPFLETLKTLNLSGPMRPVAEFLQFVGTQQLQSLKVDVAPPFNKRGPPRKKRKISSMESNVNANVSAHKFVSRWAESLVELTFASSGNQLHVEFAHISCLQVIESIRIEGCSCSVDLSKTGQSWSCLKKLSLPQDFLVSFSLLRQITNATHHLEELTACIDITHSPQSLNDSTSDSFRASLVQLKVIGCSDKIIKLPNLGDSMSSEWRSIKEIARFLIGLFPRLQKLDAVVDKKHWGIIWELVELCRLSNDDQIRRLTGKQA